MIVLMHNINITLYENLRFVEKSVVEHAKNMWGPASLFSVVRRFLPLVNLERREHKGSCGATLKDLSDLCLG